jgi:hypothetical protein
VVLIVWQIIEVYKIVVRRIAYTINRYVKIVLLIACYIFVLHQLLCIGFHRIVESQIRDFEIGDFVILLSFKGSWRCNHMPYPRQLGRSSQVIEFNFSRD